MAAQAPIHGGCGSAQTPVSSRHRLGLSDRSGMRCHTHILLAPSVYAPYLLLHAVHAGASSSSYMPFFRLDSGFVVYTPGVLFPPHCSALIRTYASFPQH
jgi:hypothetical protein